MRDSEIERNDDADAGPDTELRVFAALDPAAVVQESVGAVWTEDSVDDRTQELANLAAYAAWVESQPGFEPEPELKP